MPTYIVSKKIYEWLKKQLNWEEEPKPKYEGGVLKYIPSGDMFADTVKVTSAPKLEEEILTIKEDKLKKSISEDLTRQMHLGVNKNNDNL